MESENKIQTLNQLTIDGRTYSRDELINRETCAKALQIKPNTLSGFANKYGLKFYKAGARRVLFRVGDVLDFIENYY